MTDPVRPEAVHRLRQRAESFGAVAADYDRFRPSYPEELIQQLAALAGGDPVLDVGTGTGKAGAALLARGCDVLGVEVDPQMAEVARGHGLPVEVSSFERWDAAGRTFGLITAAQAWHWVDPAVGAPTVCGLLRPGGSFVAFWNFDEPSAELRAVYEPVYARVAPQILTMQPAGGRNEPYRRSYLADLQRYGTFASVTDAILPRVTQEPVEHWVARLMTHSDHLTADPSALAALREALVPALREQGDTVTLGGGTYVVRATMPAAAAVTG